MKKAYLFAGISIFFCSTVSVTTKVLLGSLNNFQLLWANAFFAFVSLIAINIVTGNIKRLKEYKFKDYIISVLIGLPGTCLYYIFFYAGTDMMPASQAFIINYLWPIMSVVFACIVLKEKLTVRKMIAILMSFIGVIIVTFKGGLEFDITTLIGASFCVLGAVSYGVFTAFNQKMQYDSRISMMINFFVTFIITSVINAVNGDLFIPSVLQTLGFAYSGICAMAVTSTLWIMALNLGDTAKISNLAYITPFLSLILSVVILKEQFEISYIIGLAFIVLGIFVQLKDKKEKT